MALSSNKVTGISPIRLFCARSKTCRELKFESWEGSLPKNTFDLKLSITRFMKAVPIHEGTLPDNWL
ncbi:unnamed protein product, partial [Vitis vinifera]|uniref:Uncharacterized protein n=1 Tax=Vitis vinifera TaxID=29760 RepID=D7SS45_VITVI